MEEQEQIEPIIEVIKPVKTIVRLNGYAKGEDNKYSFRWADGTDKVIDEPEFVFMTYDFMQALQQGVGVYQLNSNKILSIKTSTI